MQARDRQIDLPGRAEDRPAGRRFSIRFKVGAQD